MRRIAILSGVLLGLGVALARPVHAQEIFNFGNDRKQGGEPSGGLVTDASGALYGPASGGGTGGLGDGVVYRLTAPPPGKGHFWTEQVLWDFGVVAGDGTDPRGDLLMDSTGAIYGTTHSGGAFNAGTVYQLTPPAAGQTAWTESILLSFSYMNNAADGISPSNGLIKDTAGDLYGVAGGGDNTFSNLGGIVFELSPPAAGQTGWTEHVLYTFGMSATDGTEPDCKLVMDATGNLYGTTQSGGSGYGTVFELSPPAAGHTAWTETILYDFNDSSSGKQPLAGLALGKTGALYGTTSAGGSSDYGTVFVLAPPLSGGTRWRFEVLHNFTGTPDGKYPYAAPTVDALGDVYGSALEGGTDNPECAQGQGCGGVFKLTPSSSGGFIYAFDGAPAADGGQYGANPASDLVIGKGNALYGTAGGGNYGVVYEVPQ